MLSQSQKLGILLFIGESCFLNAMQSRASPVRREKKLHEEKHATTIQKLDARALNLELCSRTLLGSQVSSHFDINLTSMPHVSEVRICEDRSGPHAGMLYIKDFVHPSELPDSIEDARRTLSAKPGWKPNSSYAFNTIEHRMLDKSNRLAKIEKDIDALTGRPQGRFQVAYSSNRVGSPLHHDHAQHKQKRYFTAIVYLTTPEHGGHTMFPFLSANATAGSADPSISEYLTNATLDVTKPIRDGPVYQRAMKQCDEIAADDAAGRRSPHFAIRPMAGDLFLFWHTLPGSHVRTASEHFHVACRNTGDKTALQKFAEWWGPD
eukprot:gnl/TRDRNA2_/TRDRNA2_81315_c0_seq1.p1 gnl/TRDRNA2_/TRDRNA2_81315_c0~~gnl/TRDRNA2_/TRDRNA2_81315_c0_seq1.p1  ORF type:complete len:321 (-),score=30.34 gnl/TRDRNA2_/TRDRNA2_81315_c0_seq1:115-1077(-)